MDYADGGDLHNYLQKDFANITWNKKINILWSISEGYLFNLSNISINCHFNINILLL
jgi:hypothetical protein